MTAPEVADPELAAPELAAPELAAPKLAVPAPVGTLLMRRGGQRFVVLDHPSSRDGQAAFDGPAEAPTLAFFDATLPHCDTMIDLGAYVGFMSLYAATRAGTVHAVEACPAHQALLRRNLRANPDLAPRIVVHPVAIGERDGAVALFRKGDADSGTSVFQMVERGGVMRGRPDSVVARRDATGLLTELGLGSATLLKMDIEGAEYLVLPGLRDLLARALPPLLVSFHPFNLVAGTAYLTALRRLRAALDAAEALEAYRFMYVPVAVTGADVLWRIVGPEQRMAFLQNHLLAPKPVPRIATPQHGFVDVVGFSPVPLPGLRTA